MRKTIRNLLLFNFFLVAVAVGVYAIGYEYDKANKLYPEPYYFASDASITTYGRRWERAALTLISLGVIVDIAAGFIWYRRKQSEDKSSLDLAKENK